MAISLSLATALKKVQERSSSAPHSDPRRAPACPLAGDGHLVTSVGKMDALARGPTTVVCAQRTGCAGLLQTQRTS